MCGSVPRWLVERLLSAGGSVPFRTYMDWALHDPAHGYYGSGRARIGPGGDFATSPSLGSEFASLLVPQLIEWLEQIQAEKLSLIEAGPGEGHLAAQMVEGIARLRPDLAARLELVLLEPNPGMAARQQEALRGSPIPVRWAHWADLHRAPARGVVIAHEVLDALPVDRIRWDGQCWRWEEVRLENGALCLGLGPPLQLEQLATLTAWDPTEPKRPPGWASELHSGLGPWLEACARACDEGVLLVIDYALEARRYYASSRPNGTLMAYRGQRACADPLVEPGEWDLTAHLCVEALQQAAQSCGWRCLGERRQGEALLALGLAQRLSALSHSTAVSLSERLQRREQLLRLVDPLATGDFRWLLFERTGGDGAGPRHSLCLSHPPLDAPQPSTDW